MNKLCKGDLIMMILSKNISIDIMKFFLNTSVPKILNERACIASIGKK